MKFKKLITLAIALVLSTNQALAASPADLLKELKTEKSFVLEALTGREGNDAGRNPTWKLPKFKRIFYVTDCEGQCQKEKLEVLATLQRFAEDYNQILGREFIFVNSNITSGRTSYFTRVKLFQKRRFNGNFEGYFKCSRSVRGFCEIKLPILTNRFNSTIIHEAMNTLGIYDTKKHKYKNCLVYDPSGIRQGQYDALTSHYRDGYQGLCEIEKRIIVFQHQYIKTGMKIDEVEKIFDEHWVSDTTIALSKIDPALLKEVQEKRAPTKTKKAFAPQGNR